LVARHSATVVFYDAVGGLSVGFAVPPVPYPSRMGRDRQILQAALELFQERGFGGVGVDEIGARAGVTGPAIYRHFSGKDEVLAALFDEAMDGLVTAVGGGPEEPFAELEHLARAHAQYALDHPAQTSMFTRDERSLAQPHRRRFEARKREYIKRWIDCVKRCFPDRSADELTIAVHAMLGLLQSSAGWPRALARDPEAVNVIVALALDGLRGFGSQAQSVPSPRRATKLRSRPRAA
jgi:AcrR family transcriptional regulator